MTLILMYDTQYALADQPFDIRAGVKSSAILFGEDAPTIILVLQVLFLFFIFQIKILEGLSLCINRFGLNHTNILLSHRLIRENTAKSFIKAFKTNNIVGLIIFCGLFIGYHV